MKRDIEKDEINRITAHRLCPIREKAFFTVMRQSGLTPQAITQLRIKNVERILEPDTPVPCKISIPHEKYPTFIGQEAINYLQPYLSDRATRTELTPESLLFTIRNNPNKEINTKDVSRTFKLAVQDLARNGKITLEIRRKKPSELRLYSLVKFYRKNTGAYRRELSDNITPKNDEFYRNLYEKLAMPSLEIEPPTPIEIHRLKKQQQELRNDIEDIDKLTAAITRTLLTLMQSLPEKSQEFAFDLLKKAIIEYGITTEEKLNQRTKEIEQEMKQELNQEIEQLIEEATKDKNKEYRRTLTSKLKQIHPEWFMQTKETQSNKADNPKTRRQQR